MGRQFVWIAVILLLAVFLLVLQPWTWPVALPSVSEPLPPARLLLQPPARPGTLPGEIARLCRDHRQLLEKATFGPDEIDENLPDRQSKERWLAEADTVADELQAALEAEDGVWPAMWTDAAEVNAEDLIRHTRSLTRCLLVAAAIRTERTEFEEALRYYLLCIQLGCRLNRGATALWSAVGGAVEAVAQRGLLQWMSHPELDERLLRGAIAKLRHVGTCGSWREVLRWEYAAQRTLLMNPPGISRLQRFLLSSAGAIGHRPLSILAALIHDASHWEELSYRSLWLEKWGTSGPGVQPRVPGLTLSRRDLDYVVSKHSLIAATPKQLRKLLRAMFRRRGYRRITLLRLAAHAERRRTGNWPVHFGPAVLERYELPTSVVEDPFVPQRVMYFGNRTQLLAAAERVARLQRWPLIPARAVDRLRTLLENYPDGEPLCWLPLSADLSKELPPDLRSLRWTLFAFTPRGAQSLDDAATEKAAEAPPSDDVAPGNGTQQTAPEPRQQPAPR